MFAYHLSTFMTKISIAVYTVCFTHMLNKYTEALAQAHIHTLLSGNICFDRDALAPSTDNAIVVRNSSLQTLNSIFRGIHDFDILDKIFFIPNFVESK